MSTMHHREYRANAAFHSKQRICLADRARQEGRNLKGQALFFVISRRYVLRREFDAPLLEACVPRLDQ